MHLKKICLTRIPSTWLAHLAVIVATCSATCVGSHTALGAEFRAGAAKRIITPHPLLPISGGMGPTEPARSQQGELTVRALVLANDKTRMAIVSVDALGFPGVLGDRVRAKVSEIAGENIVIGATHTHSAPDCYAFPDGQGGHTGDLAYMDNVCQQMVTAIHEALASLRPATLRVASGEVEGRVAYNYYAPDLYDRRAAILQCVGVDQQPIATLVNYAVHPEVLGSDQGIVSPDLIGPLCDRLEERGGGLGIFMNGAQGGMITADNRDLNRPSEPERAYWHDIRTWDECLRIGNTLADESLRLVKDAKPQTDPVLFNVAKRVEFPVESQEMWAVVTLSPLKYPHSDQHTVTTQMNLLTIGTAQIATIPGEALPNIGFYLKRKMHGEHNFLFGLTNDAFGYILTKVDYQSFPRYNYVSRVSMGEMTGEILIENILSMADAAPRPAKDER